jgi:hypothetical protein
VLEGVTVRQQRLEFGGLFISSWMARFVGFIGYNNRPNKLLLRLMIFQKYYVRVLKFELDFYDFEV